MSKGTGYEPVRHSLLPAETVRHILRPPRPSVIFGFRRNYPSYLASAETVHDVLLPVQIVVLYIWLSSSPSALFCFLPRLSAGREHNQADSFDRKPFLRTVVSARGKRSRTVSAKAKYDGQSRQDANICRMVYILWKASSSHCRVYTEQK